MSSTGAEAVRSAAERAARARAARVAVRHHQGVRAREARWPAEWREAFEERAAIAEYCGGLTRAEAEVLAVELVCAESDQCAAPRGPR